MGGTRETLNGLSTSEYPGLRDAKRTAKLIVIGYGIWNNFDADVVFPRLESDISVIRKNFPGAKIVWLGALARHRDDFAFQTNERVVRFNSEMFARIKDAGFK